VNNEQDLESIFKEVISISADPNGRIYGTGLWEKCHELADAQYLPAMDFFIHELEDPRWDWRRESVGLLGFHYKLDQNVIDKIRKLLLNDPDSVVRSRCAAVLGNQLTSPDAVLLIALEKDSDHLVKESAFLAILDLGRVSYKIRQKVRKKIRSGEILPDLKQLKRVFTEENVSFDFDGVRDDH
jgi:hypothetical protein